jgi:hypothetical protein
VSFCKSHARKIKQQQTKIKQEIESSISKNPFIPQKENFLKLKRINRLLNNYYQAKKI